MNINDYYQLSSLNRHQYSEILLGKGEYLLYESAIDLFNYCLSTNDKISSAFENFLLNNTKTLDEIQNKDILLYSGVDKFQKKIFFLIKNSNENNISLLSVNADNKEVIEMEATLTKKITAYPLLKYSNNSFFDHEIFWHANTVKNIEDIWNNATFIWDTVDYKYGFTSILTHKFFIGNGTVPELENIDQPICTTLLPSDIMNRSGQRTKNAQSSIVEV